MNKQNKYEIEKTISEVYIKKGPSKVQSLDYSQSEILGFMKNFRTSNTF